MPCHTRIVVELILNLPLVALFSLPDGCLQVGSRSVVQGSVAGPEGPLEFDLFFYSGLLVGVRLDVFVNECTIYVFIRYLGILL